MYIKAFLIFAAKQVIIIPSISWCGSLSNKILSLKVPGSDSSAFITKYLSSSSAKNPHLTPVGKPAPPLPLIFEDLISSNIFSGELPNNVFLAVAYPLFFS